MMSRQSSPADLKTPTSPSECALAIALPLTFDAFSQDINAWPAMDYAVGMALGRDAERAWADDGRPVATLCGELIDLVQQLGVRVVPEAGLRDIAMLLRQFSVVTVVAHWRGALLDGRHLLVAPVIFLDRVRKGTDKFSRELSARLDRSLTDSIVAQPDQIKQRANFAELLNQRIIESVHPLENSLILRAGFTVAVDDLWLQSEHRRLIEEAFPGMFLEGNRLELRDGLYDRNALSSVVPAGWSGVIDLVNCQSSYLAQAIKGGHAERRVVMANRLIDPNVRLRIQRDLYKRIARGEGNYVVLLGALFRALSDIEQSPQMGRFSQLMKGLRRWICDE